MRHRMTASALIALVALALCGSAGWLAPRLDTARFVVPGASDVRVQRISPGTRMITFRMAEPGADWTVQLARQLRSQGWRPPDISVTIAHIALHSYVNKYFFDMIWEEADLGGDAQHARVIVHRWLWMPWLFGQIIEL